MNNHPRTDYDDGWDASKAGLPLDPHGSPSWTAGWHDNNYSKKPKLPDGCKVIPPSGDPLLEGPDITTSGGRNTKFDLPMLSQPLTTEDGFLNPACMSELNATIAAIPPTHERLADDPEWSTPRWTTIKDITSGLAKWAIRQSPYGYPEGLEAVIKYLDACLRRSVKWETSISMAQLSLCQINKLLYDILYEQGFKPFDAWNVAKNSDGEKIAFVFGNSSVPPDSDFIDLDALLHNVCIEIRGERRAMDEFNRKFEAKHPST